jgi:hypothetical protein
MATAEFDFTFNTLEKYLEGHKTSQPETLYLQRARWHDRLPTTTPSTTPSLTPSLRSSATPFFTRVEACRSSSFHDVAASRLRLPRGDTNFVRSERSQNQHTACCPRPKSTSFQARFSADSVHRNAQFSMLFQHIFHPKPRTPRLQAGHR